MNVVKRPVFQQMQKKTLSHILGVMGRVSAAPRKRVQRVPVPSAEIAQR